MNRKKKKGQKLSEAEVLVNMPQSLKDRLIREAEKRQLSVSSMIRMALLKWLES